MNKLIKYSAAGFGLVGLLAAIAFEIKYKFYFDLKLSLTADHIMSDLEDTLYPLEFLNYEGIIGSTKSIYTIARAVIANGILFTFIGAVVGFVCKVLTQELNRNK